MKIPEERALATLAVGEAVKFGEERIREFAGVGGSRVGTQNGCRCRAQIAAVGGNEIFPGGFASFHARGGQRQIFEVQGAKIGFEIVASDFSIGKMLLRAALEGGAKLHFGECPLRSPRESVELRDEPLTGNKSHEGVDPTSFFRPASVVLLHKAKAPLTAAGCILEHKPVERNPGRKTSATRYRFAVCYGRCCDPDPQLKPPRRVKNGCAKMRSREH